MFLNIFFLFLLGLAFGSFLNVVIFRYRQERSIFNISLFGGRSHCFSCKKKLRWYELMPIISFLIQKGRCRSCGVGLSWQYPLVELASGLIFILPFYLYSFLLPNFYFLASSVIWIAAFLIFILIWAIDYRLFVIPDGLNIGIILLGFLNILLTSYYKMFGFFQGSFMGSFSMLFGLRQNIWLNHFVGALAGIAIIGLIIVLTRGRGMGMGDLKLLAAMGFLYGWPDVIFIFVIATIAGSLVSLFLMAINKKTMKSYIPFGPLLIFGGITVFFFGENLLRIYFNFFGL